MSEGFPPRLVVLDMLYSILEKKQSLDTLLERDTDFNKLPTRDRAFAHMLLATTLRNLGQCDDLILKLQDRVQPHMQPALKNILRIGLVQLIHMNVADHAAVNTSVELCEQLGFAKSKNFVNALLRRFLREKDTFLAKQDTARLNIPEWLLKPLIADWGLSQAADIGASLLTEAPLDITIKNPGMLEHWLAEFKANHVFHNTLRLKTPHAITSLSGFHDGHWWVQDAAAALPVQIMGDVKDKLVYDLCAAPGGKTAQLAAAGARVVALDRSAKRLVRLSENMARLGLQSQVETITTDAAEWKAKEPADMVLIDAPCSATGIIRRHPDILHLKSSRDIDSLTRTQQRIFDRASTLVKPGGTLIYCTCSILKAEGEDQVAAFLAAHPDFARSPITPADVAGHETFLNEHGDIRLFPTLMSEIGGLDGFFIARLIKK